MVQDSSGEGNRFGRIWSHIAVALLAVIATSAAIGLSRYQPARQIEVIPAPSSPSPASAVYVGGNVTSPGYYPLRPGDTVNDLLRDAGSPENAGSDVRIYVSGAPGQTSQKVDLNRAPAWLLQALPGIGEARAQAIIRYRQQNGRFKNTRELTRVDGISDTIYERIKNLVTVAD